MAIKVMGHLLLQHLYHPRLIHNKMAFYASWRNQNFSLLHYNQLKQRKAELQIKKGIEDNAKIIFLISQKKTYVVTLH